MISKRSSRAAIWCLCVLASQALFLSCNERVKGCLDVQAENFDVEAEKNETSLCRYPALVLNVLYQWDGNSLFLDSAYTNGLNQRYFIRGVQILVSGFEITDAAADIHTIREFIDIRVGACTGGTDELVPDDYLFVDRSNLNFRIGTFRESGLMQGVSVSTGVPGEQLPMCRETLPASHRLSGTRAGYRSGTGDFAVGRFIVSLDSLGAQRDTFFAYADPVRSLFPLERDFRTGLSDTLRMSVDFYQIFNPVDWSQSHEEIAEQMGQKVAGALMIR